MIIYLLYQKDNEDNDENSWVESLHKTEEGARQKKRKIIMEEGYWEKSKDLYLYIEEMELQD